MSRGAPCIASRTARHSPRLSTAGRLMAERTTQSWTTVPHFFVTREVDAGALNAARDAMLPAIERSHAVKVTHTDLIAASVARVLRRHARLNASWTGDGIVVHPEVNVALALAVDNAVVTGVIRGADAAAIADIALRRRELAERARAGRLHPDDIAGARSLYSAGVTSNVSFPPRNEPNDFYAQLIVIYRDLLRAAAVTTYVDPEGVVVWLSEYARYRVGLCDHGTATIRVFSQIDNTGVYGVCALTPAGPIPFPPRDEGLDFMNGLDVKYHDGLRRSAMSSFVNNEGAVVWVLEYFRYRLNGCTHGDATAKVLAQIRGEGIQPVCL